MPFHIDLTEHELEQVKQAKKQRYIIDSGGRFSTSPACLAYLHYCEQQELPYIIVRKQDNLYDVYIDLPGKSKWTVHGFTCLSSLFAHERLTCENEPAYYRVTADNCQYEGLRIERLTSFIEQGYKIASEHTSPEFISLRTLKKLQRQNTIREGEPW